MQIDCFDGDLAPGRPRRFVRQGRLDRRRRDRLLGAKQLAKCFFHTRLALPRRQVQDPQILAVSLRRLVREQRIIGHAEVTRGEQLLPIAIVSERSRLPHQPVNDVPVVDAMLVASAQTRQALDQLLRVPHFEVFHEEADLDLFANQPTRHGVAVAIDVDQTAAINASPDALASFQAPGR
jgi:hypothetical protein